jgi:hypothetical protein
MIGGADERWIAAQQKEEWRQRLGR